jgi:serine/threonine protein kinase
MLISDFGIAHFSEEDLLTAVETKADQRLANFIYAAPEQKARGKRTDGRTDIFALGLMLNEIFTGIVPHGTGYASIESVSAEHAFLDPLVERMTRNRPEDRPQTVEALLLEIEVRAKEFASRRNIDSIKLIKIEDDVPHDPLILDPIQLIGIDYSNGALHFKLSQSVNQLWVQLFKNIGAGLVGFLPANYSVQGDSASIRMDGRQPGFAQELTNYFKGYLEQTNQAYLRHVQMMSQRAAKEEQAKLAKKLAEEEHRLQILATIKI